MLLLRTGRSRWAGSGTPRCCGAALLSSSSHDQLGAQPHASTSGQGQAGPRTLPVLPALPARWAHVSLWERVVQGRSTARAAQAGSAARVTWAERDRGAPADPGVGSGLARGRVLLFWNGVHWQSGMWEACIIVPAHTTPAPSQHDQPLAFMSNNIHPKFSKRQKKASR